MAADLTASTVAVTFTGPVNSPFVLIYTWFFVAYGTRYAPRDLLWASTRSNRAACSGTVHSTPDHTKE